MPPRSKPFHALLAVFFSCASCIAAPTTKASFFRNHCLFIKNGYLKSESASPSQILAEYERQSPGKPLVIHFHGGLVSEDTAKKEAVDLYHSCYGEQSYPIYFVWNADFFTELGNLLESRYHNAAFSQGHISTALFLDSIYQRMKAGGVDTSKIKGDAFDMVQTFKKLVSGDPATQKAAEDGARDDILAAGHTWSDWTKLETWQKAKDRAQRRVTNYFSPYVEGIARYHDSKSVSWNGDFLEWVSYNLGGRDIWSRMKQDTADSFTVRNGIPGAGLSFLKALSRIPDPPRIVLVGHSTGCIYILNFLRAAKAIAPTAKFDVVFLAPANTYQDTARFLAEGGDSIRNFRMFGIRDVDERKDHMLWELNPQLEGLYPGSLLCYVSRAVESRHNMPILGLERDFPTPANGTDRNANLIVRRYLLNDPRRIIWSPTLGADGSCCTCVSHGDFCGDAKTLASLRYLVASPNW